MGTDDHADPTQAGGIHHVELAVPALDVALECWGWVLGELGYEPKNDWDGGRSWIQGSTYVVIRAATEDGAVTRRAPGLDHLAFHAASRDQVDRITEGVRERQTTNLLYEDQHPYAGGYYAVYFEDPAGFTVEIVGPDAQCGES